MGEQVTIRQAGVEDLPAIQRMIRDCYGPVAAFKSEARWRWQFLETPYPSEPSGLAPVWIATLSETVIGQIAVQPATMYVAGRPFPAGWIVDVMVRPEHRGRGVANRIHDAIAADGRTVVTLTMALATRKIAERAGAITLPPVYELVRPERLSGHTLVEVLKGPVERRGPLVRALGTAFLASGVGPAMLAGGINLAAGLGRAPVRPATTSDSAPDAAQADALFARCQAAYPAMFDRGAAFLNWRFGQAPDLVYDWVQARQGETLTGLALLRAPLAAELPVGVLSDLIAPPEVTVLDELVARAVAAFSGRTEAIVAGASHPAQLAALKRHGFKVVRAHHPTVVSADKELLAELSSNEVVWSLSKADHDWDQVNPVG